MSPRFPVLSLISVLIRIAGWLAVAAALLFVLYQGVIEPSGKGHEFAAENTVKVVTGLGFAVVGLLVVAWGESIGVLLAIEANTFQALGEIASVASNTEPLRRSARQAGQGEPERVFSLGGRVIPPPGRPAAPEASALPGPKQAVCPNCGFEQDPSSGNRFCEHCGQEIPGGRQP
jgi:hypothetical protein